MVGFQFVGCANSSSATLSTSESRRNRPSVPGFCPFSICDKYPFETPTRSASASSVNARCFRHTRKGDSPARMAFTTSPGIVSPAASSAHARSIAAESAAVFKRGDHVTVLLNGDDDVFWLAVLLNDLYVLFVHRYTRPLWSIFATSNTFCSLLSE